MSSSRVVTPRLTRLELFIGVLFMAMLLAMVALNVKGRPSLALSLLVLLFAAGEFFYYVRLRPRRPTDSRLSAEPASTSSSGRGFSKERLRFIALMYMAALAGGGGLTALGLDDTVLGVALMLMTSGLLAVASRLRWLFE